jgi:hypothetical protein
MDVCIYKEIADVKERKADLHIKFDEPKLAQNELIEILKIREQHFATKTPLTTNEQLAVTTHIQMFSSYL